MSNEGLDDSRIADTDADELEEEEEGKINNEGCADVNPLNLTREHIGRLKKDCKLAGVDAGPALELLENSFFGQEKRIARNKKPRSKVANVADEEDCIKKIDQARKATITSNTKNQTTETGKDPTKAKKTSEEELRAKTTSKS
jgi:hypothetical protein